MFELKGLILLLAFVGLESSLLSKPVPWGCETILSKELGEIAVKSGEGDLSGCHSDTARATVAKLQALIYVGQRSFGSKMSTSVQ